MKIIHTAITFEMNAIHTKTIRRINGFLILVACLFFSAMNVKAEIPAKPDPPKLVNDFAGILSQEEAGQLENKLAQFARETSTQIVIVTVPGLDGYDPGDYAVRLGENWGVGQKGANNGLVILVKPKTANERGRIFIATGYGLEGVLPDATVNGTIIDKEIIPHFQQNNYYQGLDNGTNVIMDITRGEYTAQYYEENYASQDENIFPVLFILFLIFIIFPIIFGSKNKYYNPGKNVPFWIALGLLTGGKSHSGSFGGFSSGSRGFGGFGGGSFGGGGAGGSW